MSRRIIDWKTGVVSTVGAVLGVVCDSDVIPEGSTVTVDCFIQGRETTTGALASASFQHRAQFPVAGALTLVGVLFQLLTIALGSDIALAGAVPAIVLSGGRMRLQVTGVAATTIEWFGDMKIRVN